MPLPCRWLGRALAWALLVLLQLQHGDAVETAVISVSAPASFVGNTPGQFATFSKFPVPEGKFTAWVPTTDRLGCIPQALPAGSGPFVAVVERGECFFSLKAELAQQAGAKGILIVNNESEEIPLIGGNETPTAGIFVIGVAKSMGDAIRNLTLGLDGEQAPVIMSFSVYGHSLLDVSEAALVLLATFLVAAGAFFSTADIAAGSDRSQGSFARAVAAPEEEVLEINALMAVGFCVVGSCFLMILFFFMKYLIYVIIFAFCMGGISCISQFGSICLTHLYPEFNKKQPVNVPLVGPVMQSEIAAGIPALILVVCWVYLRNTPYGWPMQDIIGAGFLCWLQRTLRLPSIKIATILLCSMFFFDIFWVFISPLLFQGHSVMVKVARGGDTGETVPMLLKIPAWNVDPFGGHDYRLLGFGDIALPGLLVSFLRRHDIMSNRSAWSCSGYFVPALIGYFIGLCCTITALIIMKMGQPALLYLVPGTLGTTLVLATCRGELQYLWDGEPAPEAADDAYEDSGDASP